MEILKMKKIIAGLMLMLVTSVSYAEIYTCTGYANGSIVGTPLKVNATKVAIAEEKAADRMKKAGLEVDYVHCK